MEGNTAKASLTYAVTGSELMIAEEYNLETVIDNSIKLAAQCIV